MNKYEYKIEISYWSDDWPSMYDWAKNTFGTKALRIKEHINPTKVIFMFRNKHDRDWFLLNFNIDR